MDAPRDGNFIPSALFESTTNPRTVLPGKIDEATGKILVDATGVPGVVVPLSVTTAQKDAIVNPTPGTIVYDTDLDKLCVYTSTWETITSA